MPIYDIGLLTTPTPTVVALADGDLRIADGATTRTLGAAELDGGHPVCVLRSATALGVATSSPTGVALWRCPLAHATAAPFERVASIARLDDEALEARLGAPVERLGELDGDDPLDSPNFGGERLWSDPNQPYLVFPHRGDVFEIWELDAPERSRLVHVPGFVNPLGGYRAELYLRFAPLAAILVAPDPGIHNNEPGAVYYADLSSEAPRFVAVEKGVHAVRVNAAGTYLAAATGVGEVVPAHENLKWARFVSLPGGQRRGELDLFESGKLLPFEASANLDLSEFSRDGGAMVVHVSWDRALVIVDVELGDVVQLVRPDGREFAVDVDGATIALALGRSTLVFGRHGVARIPAELGAIRALGDGVHWLVEDGEGHALWDLAAGEAVQRWTELERRDWRIWAEAGRLWACDGGEPALIELDDGLDTSAARAKPFALDASEFGPRLVTNLVRAWFDLVDANEFALALGEPHTRAMPWRDLYGRRLDSFPLTREALSQAERLLAEAGIEPAPRELCVEVAARLLTTEIANARPLERAAILVVLLEPLVARQLGCFEVAGLLADYEAELAFEPLWGPVLELDAPWARRARVVLRGAGVHLERSPERARAVIEELEALGVTGLSADFGARLLTLASVEPREQAGARASLRRLIEEDALELAEGATIEPLVPLMIVAREADTALEARVSEFVEGVLDHPVVEDLYLDDDSMTQWLAVEVHGDEQPRALLESWSASGVVELGAAEVDAELIAMVAVAVYGSDRLDQRAQTLREALESRGAAVHFGPEDALLLRDLVASRPSRKNAAGWLRHLAISGKLRMYKAKPKVLTAAATALLYGREPVVDRVTAFLDALTRDDRLDDHQLTIEDLLWWTTSPDE